VVEDFSDALAVLSEKRKERGGKIDRGLLYRFYAKYWHEECSARCSRAGFLSLRKSVG